MIAMCDTDAQAAGTIMVQQLPDEAATPIDLGNDTEESEDWKTAVILMSSVKSTELLNPSLPPSDLLFRLFHEEGVRLFDDVPVRNQCRCSEQKVRATLKSFPRTEIDDMSADGVVTVTCEFCKIEYTFDDAALDILFSEMDT